jgi:hypothetical protein
MQTYSKTTACACLMYLIAASVQATAAVPAGLPNYFALGLKSDHNNLAWMPQSGVPWNYRFQYLNVGWESWSASPGQFVTNYIQDSVSSRYIPVFDWYEAGSQSYNSSMLFSNLSTPSFMNAYFASWKLMLQKAGAANTTVIVHIEPDMWSFMQQQISQDPTQITVSVALSGLREIAGFANNASGFAKALVALRDTYAPNVLLAWDNSMWAVNYDPTCYYGCWDGPASYGNWVAGWYQKLGAKFDLIFFNTSSRDAGYLVTVLGWPSGYAWWTNTAFSNFQQYTAAIYQATGLKSILWQTPVGNTLYDTCNNTEYHYQDNKAQYFLQSGNTQIQNFVNAGVIGILFVGGNDGGRDDQTHYWDRAGDGITNPPAIDGNARVSNYADDDGGFLRQAAAAYYASGPVPVP